LKFIRHHYESLVASGAIERDAAQLLIVDHLDQLAETLNQRGIATKGSALGWLFHKSRPEPPKGYYIWGYVGRGKTMLMDLFYDAVQSASKRRVHFHSFMADVHKRIHEFRQSVKDGAVKDTDPIPPVATALARESHLICFDEFTVTDIADAMILGRLFTALFDQGVVVVATSNVVPDRLYEGGLNRALFLPFIDLLSARMQVMELDARTDFRMEKLGGLPVYYTPADGQAAQAVDEAFARLGGGQVPKPMSLTVLGHALDIPFAMAGVARFHFADLCEKPLGASDYLAIAKKFHTVIIENIPQMGLERRNEAKRFITLIDMLYDNHVKLIASAQSQPHELYLAEQGREAFEFDRTVSRLIEMRSQDYMSHAHGAVRAPAVGTSGVIET
jgi:cell division protein ZapE